ncbi:MAG TPA: class I tRNA ligase family protein, partial [Bryobacteraceae bacterium]|nr:class I tRNA ligase family protein [Bryobacteraceae bacterium]
APILSFTAEEVWSSMPLPAGAPGSVHLALFPEPDELIADSHRGQEPAVDQLNSILRSTREEVLKELEIARQEKRIGAPLEAKVVFGEEYARSRGLQTYPGNLPELFIVSQVEFADGDAPTISIERADGVKCERCWKYTADVGGDGSFPTICGPCASAVRQILS